MCGIFAYTGRRNSIPILLGGLRALEYRGYDSAGLYNGYTLVRSVGEVDKLSHKIDRLGEIPESTYGIAHTRWATHGAPSERNAHPMSDCLGNICVVHNGIIENYHELKEALSKKGHKFVSDTDSETIAHLLEDLVSEGSSLEEAIFKAVPMLSGTFGLAVSGLNEPNKIFCARLGSPLIIGVGKKERFVASDPSPILSHTKQMVYLSDGEIAIVTEDSHQVFTFSKNPVERMAEEALFGVTEATKGGHPHFMLKEIMEGGKVVEDSLRGRILTKEGAAKLGGLESVRERLTKIKRILILGCGTSYYAALTGKHIIEGLTGIATEADIASEFRYGSKLLNQDMAVIAVSQSGETADTLAAIRESKKQGCLTLGVVNVVGSSIAREVDAGVYTHAGPEISVASTKAFLSQVSVLSLLALYLREERGIPQERGKKFAEALSRIPTQINSILDRREQIRRMVPKYLEARDFLFIGRKFSYPIALEGALKFKEINYVHAEGYAAGEMKHGPLAMIDKNFPTVVILPKDEVREKTFGNMEEIRARGGKILAIATEGDQRAKALSDDIFYVPETVPELSPLLTVVPLQLFAYFSAAERGLPIDKPRNLAKSVTVE